MKRVVLSAIMACVAAAVVADSQRAVESGSPNNEARCEEEASLLKQMLRNQKIQFEQQLQQHKEELERHKEALMRGDERFAKLQSELGVAGQQRAGVPHGRQVAHMLLSPQGPTGTGRHDQCTEQKRHAFMLGFGHGQSQAAGQVAAPTQSPTAAPTQSPTAAPTQSPTAAPTQSPTAAPTQSPTAAPTQAPVKKNGAKCIDPEKDKNSTGVIGDLPCAYGQLFAADIHASSSGVPVRVDPQKACPDNLSEGKFLSFDGGNGAVLCMSLQEQPQQYMRVNYVPNGIFGPYACCCTDIATGGRCVDEASKVPKVQHGCSQHVYNCKSKRGMITKAQVTHSNPVSKTTAFLGMKRIAACVVNAADKTEECPSVYKTGVCIDCKTVQNPCDWKGPWMNEVLANLFTLYDGAKLMYKRCLEKDPEGKKCKAYLKQAKHYAKVAFDRRSPGTKQQQETLKDENGGTLKVELTKVENHMDRSVRADRLALSGNGAAAYGCTPSQWFHLPYANEREVPKHELTNFVKHCTGDTVFDSTGAIKKEFECNEKDSAVFREWLKSF